MLIAYYSLEGNTKCIADSMAQIFKADVEEIKTIGPIDAHRFMDHYWGGDRENPPEEIEIVKPERDPSAYDLIIIGTPVWAWAPAPPVHTFIKKLNMKGKKVAIYACSEGEPGKTFEKMRRILKGNSIISEREFINPRKDMDGTCSLKAQDWARSLARQAA